MRDLICDVINYCAWGCDMHAIFRRLYHKIVNKNLLKRKKMEIKEIFT